MNKFSLIKNLVKSSVNKLLSCFIILFCFFIFPSFLIYFSLDFIFERRINNHKQSILSEMNSRLDCLNKYSSNKRYFHFLPFDGGMRTVLEAKADGVPIQKFEFEYLQRFVDEKKIERRKKEKTERIQRQAERFPEDKYIISFDKLKDFLGIKEKKTYKCLLL